MRKLWVTLFVLWMILLSQALLAEPAQTPRPAEGEEVEIKQIQEKYWARGNESQMGVVQNRLFTKSNKFSFGVLGGIAMSDPFLSVKPVGGEIGYHFSEYWGIHVLGWKSLTSSSSALDQYKSINGGAANVNEPSGYVGAEGSASLLYGKLSLIGKSILYYDMHLQAGGGLTFTQDGNWVTPHVGLGQRFWLTQTTSLRLDYRMMYYRETIREKVVTSQLGQPLPARHNFTHAVTLGVDFMMGF